MAGASAGMGESFWQFRRYASARLRRPRSTGANRPSRSICSCASANGKRPRPSGSGATAIGACDSAPRQDVTKLDRANLLLLALASLAGARRRAGRLARHAPYLPGASRFALTRIGHALLDRRAGEGAPAPSAAGPPPRSRAAHQLVWLSDFWSAGARRRCRRLSAPGAAGHLVRIVDPAEEDFPYTGRARFESPRGTAKRIVRPGRKRGRGLSRPFRRPWRKRSPHAATKLGWTITVASHRSCAASGADRAACRHRRPEPCHGRSDGQLT